MHEVPAAADAIPDPAPGTHPVDLSFPASAVQERVWLAQRLDPADPSQNLVVALRIAGDLDRAALRRAVGALVGRHEALRTIFAEDTGSTEDTGRLRQVVREPGQPRLDIVDLTAVPAPRREQVARESVAALAGMPFDLTTGPLLRVVLVRLGPDDHVFAAVLHQIIFDDWSATVFTRELRLFYAAELAGQPADLRPLPIQFADFAAWQRQRLTGPLAERQLAWWRRHLQGAPFSLDLKVARRPPDAAPWAAGSQPFTLPTDVADGLRELSRRSGATLFMTALTLFQVLLARLADADDVVVGTPSAGRTRAETENVIGFFVNLLPMRLHLTGEPGFLTALARTRQAALEAYVAQDVPFDRIVRAVQPPRSAGTHPLFQALFNFFNTPGETTTCGKSPPVQPIAGDWPLRARPFPVPHCGTTFDLSLNMGESDRTIWGEIEYRTRLFDDQTAAELVRRLVVLARSVIRDPTAPVSRLALLDATERHRILVDWNRTAAPSPAGRCVHHLFLDQAARTPHALAVSWGDERVTYADLAARAARLAHRLRDLDVGPESRVGLCLDRCPDMVAAMLAIMLAGGAYVPLEPTYPAPHLARLVRDAGIAVVVTAGAAAASLPGEDVVLVRLDDPAEAARLDRYPATTPASGVRPDNLAYAIYTSGSTGQPKAALVPHRAAVNTHAGYVRAYGLDREPLNHLQAASMSFDVCTGDLLRALLTGGGLVICPRDVLLDPARLYRLLHTERIGCAELVPAVVRQLTAYANQIGGNLHNFRVLVVGSDSWYASEFAVTRALLRPSAKLINVFGITETAIDSTCWEVACDAPAAGAVVPIGRPFVNQTCYLLDRHGEPVPPGVPGELFIGGASVTRGYLGRFGLTARRFVADPFAADGSRLYRTGDLARHTADGDLEFLGRVDHQITLRGYRIEPGEIESVLSEHPGIREAAVTARPDHDGAYRLLAWYVSASPGAGPEPGEVRRHLRARLPEHMVPAVFTRIDQLPHNANGKIDRGRLADRRPARREADNGSLPATPTEHILAQIWREVLGVAAVRRDADFFELGGHSLLATQVVGRLPARLRTVVPLRAMFDTPVLHELAAAIDARDSADAGPPLVPVPHETSAPVSFAQQRLWFLDRLSPGMTEYNVPLALRLSGPLDVTALRRCLDDIVARHEVLRTTFAERDGAPVQVIGAPRPVALPVSPVTDEAHARRLASAAAGEPFDLGTGPLLRARLLRLACNDHVLVLVLHHIVADEWSTLALTREITRGYAAAARGDPPAPPPPVQYADYAIWQRQWLTGERYDRQLSYWRGQLADLPTLDLPADRPRPRVHRADGAMVSFQLPGTTADRLRRLARDNGATMFMTLLTGFAALLHRYTGQTDLAIGTPIAGRTHPDLEPLIGFFVNTLVLRLDLTDDPTFVQLLHRTRHTALDAYAHQDLPFERLVEHLAPQRDRSRHPLFQVNFTALDARQGPAGADGPRIAEFPVPCSTSKFDLRLVMTETTDGLRGDLEFATALFDRSRLARMAGHLARLLTGAADTPQRPLSRLPLMTPAEIGEPTGPTAAAGAAVPVSRLIDDQIRRHGGRTAIRDRQRGLTYAELDLAAGRLATRLLAHGVGPDTVVALALPHTVDLVVAVLAVWRAGGAYAALNLAEPLPRLAEHLRACTAALVLTVDALADALPTTPLPVLILDDDSSRPAGALGSPHEDDLAYVVFTSGSTGTPKAVAVTHGGLGHYTREVIGRLEPPEGAHWSLAVPLSVDLGLTNLVVALATGGCLTLAEPTDYVRALAHRPPDCVKLTPTHLGLLLGEPGGSAALPREILVLGGEPTPPSLLAALRRSGWTGRLYNHYGPAEATVGATVGPMRDSGRTLGTPLPSTVHRVLDRYGGAVPVGVPGELYLGGPGLARGYLGRPDLTAERFVADPYAGDGCRLYRTGDRVARGADGTIDFLGRVDQQLSLRGYRVEPLEVEEVLCQHPGVGAAAVDVRPDRHGGAHLVAWVAPAVPGDVRDFVKERLPGHLVPTAFMPVRRLPRTANGKLDRPALPDPVEAADGHGGEPPRTATEQALAHLWLELLDVATVRREDDFFDLGGHSLAAMRLVGRVGDRLGVDLPVRVVFESPRLVDLADQIDRHHPAAAGGPLPRADRSGPMPTSFAQERLWLLHQLTPDSVEYNVPIAVRLTGAVDAAALQQALTWVVSRHEVLRTGFTTRDGVPYQVVQAPRTVAMPVLDVAGEAGARAAIAAEARRPFDLNDGPPLRARLLRLAPDDHVLAILTHHIAVDARSAEILLDDLDTGCDAARHGRLPAAPAIQYADYATWQRGLDGSRMARQLDYWRGQLAGVTPLDLPTDRPRPAGRDPAAATVALSVPPDVADVLRDVARRHGATVFMTLLAALTTLLARYTGQDDVAVGTPIAGRTRPETERLVGFFVNTLVLRTDLSGNPTFTELLERVRRTALEAYTHQDVPFEKLVEQLNPSRDASRSPLFDVMLNYADSPPDERRFTVPCTVTMFDLTVNLVDTGSAITGTIEYRLDLFDPATVRRIADHYVAALRDCALDPRRRVRDVSLVDDAERDRIAAYSRGPATVDSPWTVLELIDARARGRPDAPAVVSPQGTLTYEHLRRRARAVAGALRQRGVGPGDVVGVRAEDGADWLTGILGVLDAGAAYLPVAATDPPARTSAALATAGARLLLTTDLLRAIQAAPPSGREPGPPRPAPGDLAYVIFTSGSTGTPRGVAVSHAALAASTAARSAYYRAAPERYLIASPFVFDSSVAGLFWTLCGGGTLVTPHADQRADPEALADVIQWHGVTHVLAIPSLLAELVAAGGHRLSSLRAVIAAGEPCPATATTWYDLLPGARIFNEYGPTEATVWCTVTELDRAVDPVPIGRPIPGVTCHVLDRYGRPQPIGVAGELYVAGPTLARGYTDAPADTAQRFLADPFAGDGARLYRTGDLARWRDDGRLQFCGRSDRQLKVLGHRIDPGEVEGALATHPGIRQAAVDVTTGADGTHRLAAWTVPGDPSRPPSPPQLRAFLAERVPAHLVPAVFQLLTDLPRTATGKVDRRALPQPDPPGATSRSPQGTTEVALARIWADVLGLDRLGAEDDFFASGGHSLLAARVVGRARAAFGVPLPLRALFDGPTVAQLARTIDTLHWHAGDHPGAGDSDFEEVDLL
ncbi:MAG TPA: amino acid adenylation domain-containing protein [Planosporangium sp.]|nr:amino acid adenylation domain-containing protein [Planosporangium sp.]